MRIYWRGILEDLHMLWYTHRVATIYYFLIQEQFQEHTDPIRKYCIIFQTSPYERPFSEFLLFIHFIHNVII